MAVNDAESMNVGFAQGSIDNTYIALTPNRKNVENPPTERLGWPTYRNAEMFKDPPFIEAHMRRSVLPVEHKVRSTSGDYRY